MRESYDNRFVVSISKVLTLGLSHINETNRRKVPEILGVQEEEDRVEVGGDRPGGLIPGGERLSNAPRVCMS